MVGRHHRLNGHEFEQIPGESGGQGSLVCCGPQGRQGSGVTERLSDSSSHGSLAASGQNSE